MAKDRFRDTIRYPVLLWRGSNREAHFSLKFSGFIRIEDKAHMQYPCEKLLHSVLGNSIMDKVRRVDGMNAAFKRLNEFASQTF